MVARLKAIGLKARLNERDSVAELIASRLSDVQVG